jgi:hypothetical protein
VDADDRPDRQVRVHERRAVKRVCRDVVLARRGLEGDDVIQLLGAVGLHEARVLELVLKDVVGDLVEGELLVAVDIAQAR